MKNQLKLKIKIGQVEFEAEGDAGAVTEQRDVFIQRIVPAASPFLDKNQSIEAARVAESPTNSQIVQNETVTHALTYSNASDNTDWSRMNLVSFLRKYGNLGEQDFVLFSAYYHEKKSSPLPFVFTVSLSIFSVLLSEFLPKLLINFKFSRFGYNLFSFFKFLNSSI